MRKGRMESQWAGLDENLLIRIIENHLLSVVDFLAFSSVCASWRRATLGCDRVKLEQSWARQMPWLMLTDGVQETSTEDDDNDGILNYSRVESDSSEEDSDDEEDSVMGEDESNNLYRRSILYLRQEGRRCYNLSCPQGYAKACWGSAHGWIVSNGLNHNMYLFNPITKARLNLPSRRTFPFLWKVSRDYLRDCFIWKAIILKVPSDVVRGFDETLLVVVIYDMCRVSIAKPGDTQWTEVALEGSSLEVMPMDFVYRRDDLSTGRLLLVDEEGRLAYLDLCDVQKVKPPTFKWYGCKLHYVEDEPSATVFDFINNTNYLVNSGQDLLMVLRIFDIVKNSDAIIREYDHDIPYIKTVKFKVYKFQFDDKSWEELEDLLDIALFVGNNATMSVCATDVGCEPNCIYFTDDCSRPGGVTSTKERLRGDDMGVFRMSDKIIEPLDVGDNSYNLSSYCCPFWFTPAL